MARHRTSRRGRFQPGQGRVAQATTSHSQALAGAETGAKVADEVARLRHAFPRVDAHLLRTLLKQARQNPAAPKPRRPFPYLSLPREAQLEIFEMIFSALSLLNTRLLQR